MTNNQKENLKSILEKAKMKQSPVFVPALIAGYPDKDIFWDLITKTADSGAEILEIIIPFSDPITNEPITTKACADSLEAGVNLAYVLEGLIKRFAKLKNKGLVLSGYGNSFLQYGWSFAEKNKPLALSGELIATSLEFLAQKSSEAGVNALVVHDLPLQESTMWQEIFNKYQIDLIVALGTNSDLKRVASFFAKNPNVYVRLLAIDGFNTLKTKQALKEANDLFKNYLALEVDIEPQDLAQIKELGLDMIIFNSGFVKYLAKGNQAEDFIGACLKNS